MVGLHLFLQSCPLVPPACAHFVAKFRTAVLLHTRSPRSNGVEMCNSGCFVGGQLPIRCVVDNYTCRRILVWFN